jgi:hypothetical protein
MENEPDYITVKRAVYGQHFNVVVMRWNRHEDEYQVMTCSQALPRSEATALALSWAREKHLEVR